MVCTAITAEGVLVVVVQSLSHRPTLCDPMDCSMPSFPVLHHLLEFAQTHVQWVVDAIHHRLWDLSLVVVIGASTVHCDIRGTFLILVASLVEGGQASVAMARGLSSWGSWALEHRLSRCGAQA